MNDIKKLEQARARIWGAISDYEHRARNFRTTSENFLSTLANETGKFIDIGVAVIGKYENQDWESRLGESKLKYLKDVAKTQDRPLIYISEQDAGYPHYGTCWMLFVPKKPKLQNIVAGLLMVSDNNLENHYLVHIAHERSWEFHFSGDKGKELKDHWLEQCRSDPVFRICLNLLPVKVR